jgi:hypothetical protein
MLEEKVYYIIGNAYKNFASMKDAISYNDAIKTATSKDNYLKNAYLALGQGLNLDEKNKLKQLESEGKLGFITNRHYKLAPQGLSHKTKTHNTMISEPLLIEENKVYTSYLQLDDDCAEMSDHVTGMHLQGMVLTEAARQIMLAVSEKFLLPETLKGQAYFALRKVNSTYHQFGFPLDMQLIHTVNNIKTRGGVCIVDTTTIFEQNDNIIAEVEISYVASNKNSLIEREASMAQSALRQSIANNLLKSQIDICA